MMQLNLTARHCPVCDNADESRVFADANVDLGNVNGFAFASRKIPEYMHWRLVSCPRCDLLYANPIPRPEDLATAYHEAAFDSREEAKLASKTYGRLLPEIASHLPDRVGAV